MIGVRLTMELSKHAVIRSQQRGIPPLIMQWLLDYGDRTSTHGAVRLSFGKRSRREIEGEVGKRVMSQLSRFLAASAIVDCRSESVITVMWDFDVPKSRRNSMLNCGPEEGRQMPHGGSRNRRANDQVQGKGESDVM
jgi:hypothetical protein